EQQAVVEAAVIYHDDAKAQLLLNQAYELLAQLPQNTSSRKQQRQTLARNLDTLARRLRHQAEATTAEPWLELPGGATWRYLGLIGNSLYALSAGGQIAPLDLDGKIGSIFTLPTSLDQPLALTPLDQQYFLAWGNNGSALIDLTSRRSTMMPKIPALFDAASYDHRLYYISQKPMAIFRTTRQDTDFATPVRWLKPSQGELQGARSLTVDGAIYVATASQVQKYVLGLKRDFTLQPVEPPLQDVTSLKTAGEGDHLYLTEPALKRLVVYDKQGKLVLQLSFPNLPELTSLTYDPINKYMYVLSGSKIYRLKLTDYLP
ncbi:MAG: hypothetical protein HY974_04285, partial [Candidatus Kerfeldbacteria bacterium]|nr:hypothetical protein [Candidatus Kerfeldbacteria bacterium]